MHYTFQHEELTSYICTINQSMFGGIQVIDMYIDDMGICNDSWEDNLLTLQKVFDRLSVANFTISLVKSEFC